MFSLAVKPTIIHTILSVTTSKDWHVHQLDVKKTFLHDHLTKIVYCQQLLVLSIPRHPTMFACCSAPSKASSRPLVHSTSGFPHVQLIARFCLLGFLRCPLCTRRGPQIAYLLLYVNIIILMALSTILLLCHIIKRLHSEFSMMDLITLAHCITSLGSLSHGTPTACSYPNNSTLLTSFSTPT
jgi:hypothetical protein